MISKSDVLEADWKLLRIEISEHDESGELDAFDGFSRFWSREAVLGAYWVAERVDDTRVRLHLTDDIELEGFQEALAFTPDTEFKRELLSRCDWEEVIREIFPEEEENSAQLSLFDEQSDNESDGEDDQDWGGFVDHLSHIPAHKVLATVAPFRAWRGSQLFIAGGPRWNAHYTRMRCPVEVLPARDQ